MLDIKWIRENPQKFDAAMAARSANFKAAEILALDEEKRKKTFLIQELQAKRNKIAQEISVLKRSGADASALLEESKKINLELAAAESDSSLDEKLEALLLAIPNIPDVSVPHGKSEEENVEVEKFGSPKKFSFPPKSHDELGEKLKMLDFEQSALMSGARFSTLLGGLPEADGGWGGGE